MRYSIFYIRLYYDVAVLIKQFLTAEVKYIKSMAEVAKQQRKVFCAKVL